MKITTEPKYLKEPSEPKEQSNGSKGGTAKASGPQDAFLNAMTEDSTFPSTDSSNEPVDPWLEHLAFYGNTSGTSSSNFAVVNVPDVSEIIANATEVDITEKMEFYTALENNYKDLEARVNTSIKALQAAKKSVPQMASIYNKVIEDRKDALKKIQKNLKQIQPLKASIENVFKLEESLATDYLKEYYKWSIAYNQETKANYKGEKASLKNKPDPRKFLIDKDGNSFIGDPKTSKLVIAVKTVKDADDNDKEIEICDIINIDKGKAVVPDADGIIQDISSTKDKDFYWTISNANLKLVEPTEKQKKNEIVLQLASAAENVKGNGIAEAPIAINVPEYVRVDEKTGEILGVVGKDGKVTQEKATTTKNWVLKKVVSVRIEKEKSTSGAKGYDHVIKLLTEGDLYTPTVSIRITGTATVAASERALSLVAAEETDPRYKRRTGISIDAGSMKSEATFNLSDTAIKNIKKEYEIGDSPEGIAIFNSTFKNLAESKAMGLIVEGFNNLSLTGTKGDDLVLLEEGDKDYRADYKVSSTGAEIMPPLYTNTIQGKEGFNAIFHKGGNVVADRVGFFWGGQELDTIFLNVAKDEAVYVNARNENGVTEIGNYNDAKPKATGDDLWGNNDDFYHFKGEDFKFANIYEPEAIRHYKDPKDPKKDLKPPSTKPGAPLGDIADKALADIDSIKAILQTQMIEHAKALQDMKKDMLDDHFSFTDYKDFDYGPGYNDMKDQMDTFFAGWGSWTGGFTGEETLIIPESFKK